MLHAHLAIDSIPHSLQAFLLLAAGVTGFLTAFSLVDSSAADSAASADVQMSAENQVQSGSHEPVEHGAPGRRF